MPSLLADLSLTLLEVEKNSKAGVRLTFIFYIFYELLSSCAYFCESAKIITKLKK